MNIKIINLLWISFYFEIASVSECGARDSIIFVSISAALFVYVDFSSKVPTQAERTGSV